MMPRLRVTRATLVVSITGLVILSIILFSPEPKYEWEYEPEPVPTASSTGVGSSPLDALRSQHKVLGQWLATTDPSLPQGLETTADGLVRGWDAIHGILKRGGLKKKDKKRLQKIMSHHPILELVESGKKRWEALLERQSRTLPQAVTEYRKRYGRAPPKNFDQWWQFCKRNKVKIVDDYDQIFRDVEPYFGISPATFRKRVADLETTAHTSTFTLSPTSASSLTGDRAVSARARLLFSLLEPLAQFLPAEVVFYMSDHDLGSWLLGDDQKQFLLNAVKDGRFVSETDLKPFEKKEGRVPVKGTVSACPAGSPAWQRAAARRDGMPYDDPFPTNDTTLRPIFQLSKFIRNQEFLTTPLEAYENFTSKAAQNKFMPWEGKTIDKLFWRGSSTGDSYSKRKNSDYTWHRSHRPRLALMTQATEGEKEVWVQRGKEWDKESWGLGKLNEAYMDIGLTGGPHQCKKEDGTCDEMAAEIQFKDRVKPEDAAKFKYVFDIDGNGWSSRFHRLVMSGSVVVKATQYPEWLSDWITPWVHYVPSKIDYSDLYDIMSFFVGPPDGRSGGHDEVAKEIAEAGKKFGEEHWRWEDMQAYMFRLLLEYARLAADDREEFSFQKTYD